MLVTWFLFKRVGGRTPNPHPEKAPVACAMKTSSPPPGVVGNPADTKVNREEDPNPQYPITPLKWAYPVTYYATWPFTTIAQ